MKLSLSARLLLLAGAASLPLLITGCEGMPLKTSAGTETTETSKIEGLEPYSGPKARVAVVRFTDSTGKGWYSRNLGDGMADQLTTALVSSNRFSVVERQAIQDVMQEQNFGQSGRVDSGSAARMGAIKGADLLIIASVTEFENNSGGTSAGGGGGVLGGLLALGLSNKKSHIAIDLRMIDAATSEVVAATSVEGTSTDVSTGALMGAFTGNAAIGGALSSWDKQPIGKALRAVIEKATVFIAKSTPPGYYVHTHRPGSRTAKQQSSGSGVGTLSRKTVRAMQKILNDLGFEAGTADGIWGKKTQVAVTDFQEESGLEITGSLDPQTISALRDAIQ